MRTIHQTAPAFLTTYADHSLLLSRHHTLSEAIDNNINITLIEWGSLMETGHKRTKNICQQFYSM